MKLKNKNRTATKLKVEPQKNKNSKVEVVQKSGKAKDGEIKAAGGKLGKSKKI